MTSPQPQFDVQTETVCDITSIGGGNSLRLAHQCEMHIGTDRVTAIGYAALAGTKMYSSPGFVVNVSDGYLQTDAFIDTGSSGGPVINDAGDIVSVVSHGGMGAGLAKTRLVRFLRDDHYGITPPPPPPTTA